ncbi:MAG: NAD(P)-dependent oxidoreductase [Polyangia bacterium]
MHRIAITGSEGLIGRHLCSALRQRGVEVLRIDRALPHGSSGRAELEADNVSDVLQPLLDGCDGVVHLAAVSRVVWGQRDPALCLRTNVEGTRAVVQAALRSRVRPWVLLASSREVYGDAARLPVREDAPLQPLNVYARSKVDAEACVLACRPALRTAIVRLSSVYGDPFDHADRVVPAFCRAAMLDGVLRIEGAGNVLDLTHAVDVAAGIVRIIELLQQEASALPPIHLVSGQGTTLGELAELVRSLAGSRALLSEVPPRTYDVWRFIGDPGRARALLGWQASTPLAVGLSRLLQDYAALAAAANFPSAEVAP